ncbi:MAG: hypothetical protein ACJ780_18500 [Solirubrobacteraceae bacterium]
MSSRIRTLVTILACAASALPAAAQANAAVAYKGKTRNGSPISFTVSGSRITKLTAYVPTLCLATEGTPLSGTDPFDPSGSFRVGHTDKSTVKRANAIWNTSDVTKNFFVSAKRDRGNRISGKLHVDYSFLMLLYTYPMSARPYVCTGDTTFRLAPRG